MDTTLLQPFQFLGAVYAGFLIGIVFSVLRLFIPAKNPGPVSARIAAGILDALFYVISTGIAAWALFLFADGRIKVFMLLTMALAAFICIKSIGSILYAIRFRVNAKR